MNEQLAILIQLQELDGRLDAIAEKRRQFPHAVEAAGKPVEEAQAALAATQGELDALNRDRRAKEQDLKEREERAALVRDADQALGVAVARIKKRGINHPYVKNFVLARTTPLTRQRKTLPGFEQTFKKLVENIEAFDVAKVRYEDIQRSAIMAAPAAG